MFLDFFGALFCDKIKIAVLIIFLEKSLLVLCCSCNFFYFTSFRRFFFFFFSSFYFFPFFFLLLGFSSSVIGRDVLSPLDLEQIFGLHKGNIFHGSLSLHQLGFCRPMAAYSTHRSPVNGKRKGFFCHSYFYHFFH